jgi:hypothetical protein
MIIPIANIMSAMMTNPSSLSPIELAAKTQNRVFVLYVVVLVIGGLLTAWLTVWLWRATSRYQDAVKGDADARIAEANAEAAKANEGLARSNEKIAAADQQAGEANKRTQELAVEAEELKRQNLATEVVLEKERVVRLELEKSLSPRILVLEQDKTGKWNFDPLIKYKGMKVVIKYLQDAEAIRATNDVSNLLKAAGWDIISASPDPKMWAPFFDGVIVQTSLQGIRERSGRDASGAAADTLLNFLQSNGWTVRSHAVADDIPAMSIKISIGFKPSPYFSPKRKEGVSQWYGNVGTYPEPPIPDPKTGK